jgi:hypothetical protein
MRISFALVLLTLLTLQTGAYASEATAKRGYVLGTGVGVLANLNQPWVAANLQGALSWEYERFNILGKLDFTFTAFSGIGLASTGVQYFFLPPGKLKPFIGAELGVGAFKPGNTAAVSGAFQASVATGVETGFQFKNFTFALRFLSLLRSSYQGIPYTGALTTSYHFL